MSVSSILKGSYVWVVCVIFFTTCFQFSVFAQEVILIRHAQVDMDAKGWMGSKKAAKYRSSYDVSEIKPFVAADVLASLPKVSSDTIYTSNLFRSKKSALRLFGDAAFYVSLPLLNEYELHVVRWPLVLPYKGWTSISRVMWLIGFKKDGVESYQQAKLRTQKAVDFIERKSNHNQQVVLVTHGFLNRNIAKELERRGWHRTLNNGKSNLGATVLQK